MRKKSKIGLIFSFLVLIIMMISESEATSEPIIIQDVCDTWQTVDWPSDISGVHGQSFNVSSNITLNNISFYVKSAANDLTWIWILNISNVTWNGGEMTSTSAMGGNNNTGYWETWDFTPINLTAGITYYATLWYSAGNAMYVCSSDSDEYPNGTAYGGGSDLAFKVYEQTPTYYPNYSNLNVSPSSSVEYKPSNSYTFNATWNDTDGDLDDVRFFWNGTTYKWSAGQIDNTSNNYSITLTDLAAGNYSYNWSANDSLGYETFAVNTYEIQKNQSNPSHTNITVGGSSSIDSSVTETSETSITAGGYLDYSDGGSATLWVNNASYTNPTTQTWGVGIYIITVNTTGNENYTSNATGFSSILTIGNPPASGGGGMGGWTPPTTNCGTYIMEPEMGFSGSSDTGDEILPFTLRIWNGNVSQLFSVKEFTDGLAEYCSPVSQPAEKTPVNGYSEIVFKCVAPNGTVSGNIVIQTDTGCEDSRPVTISNALGFLADTADMLEKLGTGDLFAMFQIQTDVGGLAMPTWMIWAMILLVIGGMVVAVL